MPNHQPSAAKDFLLFLGVDVRVNENAPVKLSCFEVDYLVFLVHNGPRDVLPRIEWCAATGF